MENQRLAPNEDEGEWLSCGTGELLRRWDQRKYLRLVEALKGRCLLREEMEPFILSRGLEMEEKEWLYYVQWGALEGDVKLLQGVERVVGRRLFAGAFNLGGGGYGRGRKTPYRCIRCGSGEERLHRTLCPHCGTECPYCEACLTMGRVRFCGLLVQGVVRGCTDGGRVPRSYSGGADVKAKWGLSAAQAEAAREALKFLQGGEKFGAGGNSFLLWAVTGAGKTEMMFPLIDDALGRGGNVLIATPRKDVVLELEPRLKAAFPEERIVTLYGGSRDRWESGSVILATTHQLFRFREAFNLVVVDEIDAFPFHGDEQLLYAARAVCRPGGKFVLLSATPPKALRDLARRGKLAHAKVCVRFHRHPLPVPRRIRIPALRRFAGNGLPDALRNALHRSLTRGAQVFVFVPHIGSIPPLVRTLRFAFPDVTVEGTSSRDEERSGKVERFRGKEIRVIITTTILERGVTVPKTDVFILDADTPLFDDASLIQMAGRAGRKLEDPQGNVYFCAPEWTRPQRDAVRQICAMNSLARKKGYLVS